MDLLCKCSGRGLVRLKAEGATHSTGEGHAKQAYVDTFLRLVSSCERESSIAVVLTGAVESE
jgi:hypothetical protein